MDPTSATTAARLREGRATPGAGLLLLLLACGVAASIHALAGARATSLDAELATPREASAAAATASGPARAADGSRAAGAGAPPDPGAPAEEGESAPFSDEILESPMLSHPDFVAEVRRWVRFWETAPSEWFPDYLTRMTWFDEVVDTTLAAQGLPWSLRYLPVIESGYSPSAVSSAKAVGMWQFMAHTARDFDMEIGPLLDDRRDPFVSTAAAADYLRQLRADFGSWFLALAAYNAGPDRIRGVLRRHAPGVEPSDALYWAVRPFLPRETADFVPNLFGAIIVASDPEAHGYGAPEPEPFDFDVVRVLGAVTFEAAARATGTSRREIARLNPRYVQGVTPRERVVELRVPPGRAAAFRTYFAELASAAGAS